ncbi:MAG TPA: hypothetical protein VIZ18_10400, partial [Ktedonobacteraceae bacterium]
MIWLTWRQYRVEMLVMGIVLLLFAVVLLITGISIAAEAHNVGFSACMSHHAVCLQARGALEDYIHAITGSSAFYFFCLVLPLALPVLTGMFVGAPAIAREFEQGTYRLVWTQGIPWNRWLWMKIGLITCGVGGAFGILYAFFSWWSFPIASLLAQNGSIDVSNQFEGWGFVAIAYALFALALGIFAGTAIRKTVPAIALTLVLFVVVRVLVVNFWRPYYLPPVVVTTPANVAAQIPAGSWILDDETVNRQGLTITSDAMAVCDNLLSSNPTSAESDQYNHCITAHGFQNKVVYQPPDRFWLLQAIESGIFLLFAALLVAMTFWWTKYRIIG